ncbi:MAG: hypothetical protein AAFO29_17000, partial [Actinomycetota bacterium]
GPASRAELEDEHCWLDHDRVAGDPELTEFRRAVRHHQSRWREANGYPIGTHRVRPGTEPRLIGSHLDLDFARDSGATFLTTKARTAAQARASLVEPHQIFNQQSFWADLLSSEALAVNLFGDLATDLDRADRAVQAWWPTTPGRVVEVRFSHSPGRLDPSYSNSRRYFDAMFVLELPDGSRGALALDVTYREVVDRKGVKAAHLPRFAEIHDRSGAFAPGAVDVLGPSRLSMVWLEHLLLLSMLQHETDRWTWGRYVVVHPRANTSVSSAVDEYRDLLTDDETFGSATLEDLLGAKTSAPKTIAALRRRYLP